MMNGGAEWSGGFLKIILFVVGYTLLFANFFGQDCSVKYQRYRLLPEVAPNKLRSGKFNDTQGNS